MSTITLRSGRRICVRSWGDPSAAPVLIFHGGSHDGSCWSAVCEQLRDYRLIVPDARGHGLSDWDPQGDYSCKSQVADYLEIMDGLGIDRCVLVGHSMGGLNALELAGCNPRRVRALVLVDVGTETRKTGLDYVRRKKERSAATALKQPSGIPPARSDPRLSAHVPGYCGDVDYRRHLLRSAAAPLLVMRGEHSAILTRDSAGVTAQLVGGSVVEIPAAGHNVSLANPVGTAAALQAFLDQLPD